MYVQPFATLSSSTPSGLRSTRQHSTAQRSTAKRIGTNLMHTNAHVRTHAADGSACSPGKQGARPPCQRRAACPVPLRIQGAWARGHAADQTMPSRSQGPLSAPEVVGYVCADSSGGHARSMCSDQRVSWQAAAHVCLHKARARERAPARMKPQGNSKGLGSCGARMRTPNLRCKTCGMGCTTQGAASDRASGSRKADASGGLT